MSCHCEFDEAEYNALCFQEELVSVLEMHLEEPDESPPELITIDECHVSLTGHTVDNAALIAHNFLGLGAEPFNRLFNPAAVLRAYYLDPRLRSEINHLIAVPGRRCCMSKPGLH